MTLVSIGFGKAQATTIKNATQVDSLTPELVGGNIENGWDSFEPRSQATSFADFQGVNLLPDNSNTTDEAWIKTLYWYIENMEENGEIHFPNYAPPDGSYFQINMTATNNKTLKFKSLHASIGFSISTKYPSDELPITSVGTREFTVQLLPSDAPADETTQTIFSLLYTSGGGWLVNAGVYVPPTVTE